MEAHGFVSPRTLARGVAAAERAGAGDACRRGNSAALVEEDGIGAVRSRSLHMKSPQISHSRGEMCGESFARTAPTHYNERLPQAV